ncbi:MAG: AAA family ATPase [Terracidiphilus sp.]|jgi:pilus assembly protein CpaE
MSTAMQIPDSLTLCGSAITIAVISPDDKRRNAAITALDECQGGEIREFISYPPGVNEVSQMLGKNFDVVIVDLDSDPEYALDLVESICAGGLATVMVYSEHTDPGMMVRCMRAGAREFLTLPFEAGTMAEALVRASALRSTVRPTKKTSGKLLVFVSAKGGSGVTTLACNYAVTLAQDASKRTLLIDLNLPLGDAAISLGIKAQYSTVNALQNCSRLDAHFLSTVLVGHSSGLSVLAAPTEWASAQVTEEAVEKLLEVSCREFDYVVVDAGSRFDLQHTHLFAESSTVYIVTQIGIPELRNSNRLITKLAAEGGPKVEIVINRFDPRNQEIGEDHINKALTRPADWKIPNNYAAVRRMQNTATPLVEEESEISRSIQQMARATSGQSAPPEKKKGFRLFH